MNRRIFYLCGLCAPVVFILTAALGGALRPGYSHVVDTVSELFSPGSPNRTLLSAFYILFAVLLNLFGIGLLRLVRAVGGQVRIGSLGAVFFILVGLLNLTTATIFPQDPWGSLPTFAGRMHMIVSGIISLFSLFYMLSFGIWFQRSGLSPAFWVYSLATMAAAVLAGAWFFFSVGTPLMGLAERAAILIGFQWTIALAVLVIRSDPGVPPGSRS